ncbi:MAG: polysaccharide deacetylase family protein [Sterolibacterium sp.]
MGGLTIVMYHYVRDLQNSDFPRINGLDISAFRRQLDFLQANYSFLPTNELIACIKASKALPPNACWLTFDDGYRDHYEFVFPELFSRGIEGAFFPPVKPVAERELLDVNKIHFVLASAGDVSVVVDEMRSLYLQSDLTQSTGKSFEDLWIALAKPNRFDPAEVIFVKRMLQHALPETWRSRFADALFEKYVSTDARAFAEDLYISPKQLSEMIQAGMYVGAHGYRHIWLNLETHQTQMEEIKKSLAFLEGLGAKTDDWVMCYPYGGYNDDTLEILKSNGCTVGLTTGVGVADLQRHFPLELPRLDTNDLPQ